MENACIHRLHRVHIAHIRPNRLHIAYAILNTRFIVCKQNRLSVSFENVELKFKGGCNLMWTCTMIFISFLWNSLCHCCFVRPTHNKIFFSRNFPSFKDFYTNVYIWNIKRFYCLRVHFILFQFILIVVRQIRNKEVFLLFK